MATTVNRFLLLWMVSLGLLAQSGSVYAQVNAFAEDSVALVSFYDSTDGPNWRVAPNWKARGPVRTWEGVILNADGRVISVRLSNQGLKGALPRVISTVSMLDTLDLQFNQLGPFIPQEITQLKVIRYFSILDNLFSEKLPDFLGDMTSLTRLAIHGNNFTGGIPENFRNLVNLHAISFSNCPLGGQIPAFFGDLPLLAHVNLEYCGLSGPIPPQLGKLGKMLVFRANHNNLSGSIPPELKNWPLTTELNLEANQLSGPIPDLSALLKNNLLISLDSNKFTFAGLTDLVTSKNNSAPNATLKYSPQFPDLPIAFNAARTKFSVDAGGAVAENSYQWFDGANPVTTVTGDSTFSPQACGKYSVTITSAVATDLALHSSDTVVNSASATTFSDIITSACQGSPPQTLTPTSDQGISGTWTPATTDTKTPGTTVYKFMPAAGQCASDATLNFTVTAAPKVDAGPGQTITGADGVQLDATVTANPATDTYTVQWTPSTGLSNSTTVTPTADPSTTTLYRITATSQEKCTGSDSVLVTVTKNPATSLDVPNAFSPNGDGQHDTWQIKDLGVYYPDATVTIFNRLGQELHRWDGNFSSWDGNYNGNALPVGVYYYVIDLKKDKKKLSGSLTILR